jgi:ATP-dependent helicase/nuclease subunit B
MATIVRSPLADPGSSPWDAVAKQISSWLARERVALRDAVVVVPFVQLLAPARRAFAATGAWLPRIETTHTLAASLGPPPTRGAGELGWGIAHDTLLAAQRLAVEPWAVEWSRRDPRGFAQAAARVVTTAHALMAAAASVAPDERSAWWRRAGELVRVQGTPAAKEKLLAQAALEWAERSMAAATDRLFALRPAAWIAVIAGGVDPLVRTLVDRAAVPTLFIDADVDPQRPFREVPARPPAFHVCDGFEDEASAAAAQVLAHVERGETPVALVALDRVLVRRVRALLERSDVVVRDETGWKLATTRAGATIMATLRAAESGASSDVWLDWLKAIPLGTRHAAALEALEAALRRAQIAEAGRLVRLSLEGAAAALRDDATRIVEALARPPRRSLVDWLDALAAALAASGALERLRVDAAGQQALAALGIDPALTPPRRAQLAADLEPMTLAELTHWVDDVFERETFLPPDPIDVDGVPLAADVVITPLARAMLRPFAAAVVPGADDRRLGAADGPDPLLPRAAAQALGLPDPAARRQDELLAFAQLLRIDEITLLRRRVDDADPLANSAFVDWLALALAEHGTALRRWRDPRIEHAVAATPIRPGAPSAGDRLPRVLSASAFEALRACPYRFFAQSVLGLRAADELDVEVEKRDYGSWLHDVLHAFHVDRPRGSSVADDVARLRAIGEASLAAQGLDEAAFLPFNASFAVLVPRYVAWLHAREASGAAWSEGEVELRVALPALEGVELQGRIDRIDAVDGGAGLELIDYKTGSSSKLKEVVRDRFEDTQLGFYAALVGAKSALPLRAFYLAMDATRGLELHEHVDVATTANALLDGVAEDLRRLRAGAALPPLGEGSACEYCDARGLCRRDHWSPEREPQPAE